MKLNRNILVNNSIYIFFLIVALLVSNSAYAQKRVTGKVTDQQEAPIPGVTVVEKGTSKGTITDSDGNYSLEVAEGNTLVFSFVGFQTKEVPVGSGSNIDVVLFTDIMNLDEVVVVGYGTQRKKDITGAISIVDTEELEKSSSFNVTDRLQGRVPGISVTSSGEPGSIGSISIRGNSFTGDNTPLFVIDGVLTGDSPNLNPNDIESIQVLKDASSTAIYGNRAANGVIVITTKRGEKGAPKINASANIGIQQVVNKVDLMGAEGYARIANAIGSSTEIIPGVSTDWQEEVFNDQALVQDFNVSLSTGTEKSSTYFSLNSSYQEGTIKGPLYERFTARLNTDFQLFEGFKVGENLTIGHVNSSGEQSYFIGDFGGSGVIAAAQSNLPVIPVYDPYKRSGYGHGVTGVANSYVPNPVGVRDLYKNKGSSTKIMGNLFANYEIIEGLEYVFNFGIDADIYRGKNYNKNGQIRLAQAHQSGLSEHRGEAIQFFWENRLQYEKSIGQHSFSAMATYTEQSGLGADQSTDITGGYRNQEEFFYIDATTAPSNQIVSSGGTYEFGMKSILGRLTYNFGDRYFLTANFRRDGSSQFGPGNKWGNFPSVSGGWNLTNESFFNVAAISNLKLRGGYGVVGNADIGNYAYQERINRTTNWGVNYNLGPNSNPAIGATRLQIVDPYISWMTLKEYNIGLDLSLFEGQLEVIGDYYTGKVEDLLITVPVPLTAGPGRSEEEDGVTTNGVDAKRNGWEAQITYKKMTGDFKYEISANAFGTNNEIETLPFGVSEFGGYNTISRPGLPVGQFYLLEYQGVYSQEDIDKLPEGFLVFGDDPLIGNPVYRDINGRDENGNLTGEADGQINNDDRAILDANPVPDVQFGLNFSANYKDFDFTLFLQGIVGRDGYNSLYQDLNTDVQTNFTADFDPYIEGEGGSDPRIYSGTANIGGSRNPSTRFLENADYLRLKNVQIGYTIPWEKVEKLRLYVSGQNLLTFTSWKGVDPEFDGGYFSPGIDPRDYPNLRTLNAGINVTF